jgi:predicted nucleic acid-binding Zn ribbon protein
MYCKQCGKDYPKTKKVCSDCGMALVTGTSPASRHRKVNKVVIIVFGVIVVAIIAVFLILGLMPKS